MNFFTKIVAALFGVEKISNKELEDKKYPNLYSGKILDDGNMKWEIISKHKRTLKIKIIHIYWERLATYLDVGKIYIVHKHVNSSDEYKLWEIMPRYMKRDTSQILLFWWKNEGWSWDIDT